MQRQFHSRPFYPPPGLAGLGDFDFSDYVDTDTGGLNPYNDDISTTTTAATTAAAASPSSSSWSLDSIIGDVSKIATVGAGVYQQKTLLDINAQRLKQGLPPISSASIAPQVNFGLSPQLMLYGGIALVAVLMLSGKKH